MQPKFIYGLVGITLCCLSSIAGAEATDENVETPEAGKQTVEEILQRDPEVGDYVEETNCISTRRIRQVDVLDKRHVTFRVSRDDYYLVQLKYDCPGLSRGDPIMYETNGTSRLCVLDSIRSLERGGVGGLNPGMRCSINGFQSVTKEQIVLLKDELKVKRSNERQARKKAKQERKKARQNKKAQKDNEAEQGKQTPQDKQASRGPN